MYTQSDQQLVSQIVSMVADAKNSSQENLTPLAEVIDPDSLNALFESPSESMIELRFDYEGYTVFVSAHGEVALERAR